MKKIAIALFTCMSLSALGMDALETSLPISQEPILTKEASIENHCERGPRGHRGRRGHHGKQGKIGPQGPAGTSVAGEFGEAYLIPSWTDTPPPQFFIPNEAYGPVQFNLLGPLSSGITYDLSTSTFIVNTAGTYTIEFDVKGGLRPQGLMPINPPPLYAKLFINSADQAQTIVPVLSVVSNSLYVEAANQITQAIPAGTTIQLQALSTFSVPVYIYGLSGDPQEAAYISIEKIGD